MNIGWYSTLNNAEKALLAHMMTDYLNDAVDGKNQIETIEKSLVVAGQDITIKTAIKKPEFGYSQQVEADLKMAFGEETPHEFTLNSMTSFCKWDDGDDYNDGEFQGEDSNILCGVAHTSGGQYLFDSPVFEQNYVTLRFQSVYFKSPDSKLGRSNDYRPSSDKEMLSIALSPEQYIRVMRSDSVEIPCTILRSHGASNDEPPRSINKHEQIKEALKADLTSVLGPLQQAVDETLSLMNGKSFTSKKAMAELSEKIKLVVDAYQKTGDDIVDHQFVAAKNVAKAHAERLQGQINYEINRLPRPIQNMARNQLSPLLEDMRKT